LRSRSPLFFFAIAFPCSVFGNAFLSFSQSRSLSRFSFFDLSSLTLSHILTIFLFAYAIGHKSITPETSKSVSSALLPPTCTPFHTRTHLCAHFFSTQC
jgi:hypothetical protein